MDPRDISLSGLRYGRDLSYDDRKKLEEGASTENILNLAAQMGGVLRRNEHIDLHGEDATRREVHDGSKGPEDPFHVATEIGPSAAHTAYDMAEVFAEEKVVHAIGVAGMDTASGAGMIIAAKETVEMLPRAWEAGDREAEARVQDAMHLAVIGNLKGLPDSFVRAHVEHRKEAAEGAGAEVLKIGQVLRNNPGLRAVLQLRCDEGMKSAENAIVAGEGAERFFTLHPELYGRYQKDPAFKAGFDAVMWAKSWGPEALNKTLSDLHQRDARYSATNCVWQG